METDLNIIETSANISAKNLSIGKPVIQPETQTSANLEYVNDNDESTQWIGEDIDGAGFTIDLGEMTAIGSQEVVIDSIVLNNPELWWPNTYGDQTLYTADVTVRADGAVEETICIQSHCPITTPLRLCKLESGQSAARRTKTSCRHSTATTIFR